MAFIHILAAVAAHVTTTTSTGVAAPSSAAAYTVPEIAGFCLAGVTALLGLIGGIIAIIDFWQKRQEKRKKEKEEEDEPLVSRIKVLEDKSTKFRTVEELDKEYGRLEEMFKHLKDNVKGAMDGAAGRLQLFAQAINDEQLARARLQAQVESMAVNTQRIESAVDRLGERFDERFDRLQKLVSENK